MVLKRNWLWVVLTLIFWLAIFKYIPGQFTDIGGDSAQYIILAQSASEGKWLKAINFPNEPFYLYYPPVFPLLLFPIVAFWGRNFYLMHILVALLGYASLFFIFRIFKSHTDELTSFFITAALVTNIFFISYCAGYILSDIPYLFISSLTLFAATRYLKEENFLNSWGFITLAGLVLSYLTRYIGITLFLAVATVFIFSYKRESKKMAFIFLGYLSFFLAWQCTFKILGQQPLASHSQQTLLMDPYRPFLGTVFSKPYYLIIRFTEGANYYYYMIGQAFFSSIIKSSSFLSELAYFVLFGSVLLGLWLEFREHKQEIWHYYFLFYLLLIIFWPFKEGVRLIIPILPFILFYCLSGFKRIFGLAAKKYVRQCLYSFFGILIIFNCKDLIRFSSFTPLSFNSLRPEIKNFINLHNWISSKIRGEAVILSRKPTITYFYTQHKAVAYPFTLKPEEIWQAVKKDDVRYIIVDEFSQETRYYLIPAIEKNIANLEVVRRIGNTYLFKVKQPAL